MSLMQVIRDRAKGWLAWTVVGLISIPFALWGIQSYFNPNPQITVAKVNDREVDLREFQRAYQQERRRLRSLFGNSFDIGALDEGRLRRQTLQRVIEEELVIQAARERGLTITEAQLAERIQSLDVFRENGAFSRQRYERWLQTQGFTSSGFEQELRRSLLAGQIYTAVAGTSFVTPRELNEMLRLVGQKRVFSRLTIPTARFSDLEVSERAVREYYAEHESRFVTPERVSVRYLELSRERIAAGINPDEQELRSYYEARKANFIVPEQRRASHILITLDEDAGEEAVAGARSKLRELKRRIEQGGDFAALAREHSQDPGSARQGGDLGFFSRGSMAEPFEEAVFSMQPGQVSQLVRTRFGLHLIKLTDVQPARAQSFGEARAEVLGEYRREQAESTFFEQAERLANLTFEHPDTLTVAAEALDLEIEETAAFSRAGAEEGIAGEPQVVEAAFSPEVLEDRYNSEVLEIGDDRLVVLRVDEHEPSRAQTLDEVREEIVSALRDEAARNEAAALGRELLAALREGADPRSAAAAHELEWEDRSQVTRETDGPPQEMVRALFAMPRPGPNETVYDGLALSSGDFVVLGLHEVENGRPEEMGDERRRAVRSALLRDHGQRAYDTFVQALRERADIVVHDENI
ncbi:MAG: peptidylprolyl isomerase [Gammaproteobacteria bacterium]|nr:peptidylprolyl isomerase [Gammaproteobacteria bacterium]NIR82876.1 peptidylprolyl isomerase [Gammaproteobacteria bacterium]NIR89985.1 peptidylprolyl isomerase [Gammaproteobacteria bacterium]NIU04034.1 peptidylprolyl isomerase [Gammaproteobacteria bacterium]NIV51354.1 peptidylprolyl isomerase [Gammaproteobacteria bacterium]